MQGKKKKNPTNWPIHAFSKINELPKSTDKNQVSKLNKYFVQANKKIAELFRATVGATQKSNNIFLDIKSSKYPQDLNKKCIESIIEDFKNEEIQSSIAGNVTYRELISKFRTYVDSQGKQPSAFKLVKKLISKADKELTEPPIFSLINRKTIVSQELAKIHAAVVYNQKRLGFFGFLFHPMQTYRNNSAKKLVAELRNVQYISQLKKNGTNPQKWQETVAKFIIYGQLINETFHNEYISKCIEKLMFYYDILTEFESNKKLGVNYELFKMIHKTIEAIMDTDATLKLEAEQTKEAACKT